MAMLVCSLLAYAAIEMYRNGQLEFLAYEFRIAALLGGIGILVIVSIRAVCLWLEAGRLQESNFSMTCGYMHIHTAECLHNARIPDPAKGSTQDSGYDMSWTFARMLILIFPFGLFMLGLPNTTFSMQRQLMMAGSDESLGSLPLGDLVSGATVLEESVNYDGEVIRVLRTKTGQRVRERHRDAEPPRYEILQEEGTAMRFDDLNDAAYDPDKRTAFSGRTAILEGRFKRLGDKEFTLFRMKMTCCAADTVVLKVRIHVPQALSNLNDFDWVRVKGQVQFLPTAGGKRYVPTLIVADIRDVVKTKPVGEYEY